VPVQSRKLKEEPAEEQDAQHEDECVNYDFDYAHGFTILRKPVTESLF